MAYYCTPSRNKKHWMRTCCARRDLEEANAREAKTQSEATYANETALALKENESKCRNASTPEKEATGANAVVAAAEARSNETNGCNAGERKDGRVTDGSRQAQSGSLH